MSLVEFDAMDEVRGTYRDGVIRPDEPVSWPDGQSVVIAPCDQATDLTEATWIDTPENRKALADGWRNIQPLDMTDDEWAAWDRERQEMRRAGVEAMRKKMGL